jgi:transporter family-2 protein
MLALSCRVLSVGARPKAAETVHGFGLVLIAVVIGLFAGCLLGTQPSVNGQLGRNVEHPLQATFISFASGTAIILLISLAIGSFPPTFKTPPSQLPWWIWGGGAIGVVMVTTSLVLVPRIGSLPWFAAVMTGQTLAALVLDHYALLGNPKAPISSLRLIGGGLLIAGVLVVVQAKRIELAAATASQAGGHDSPKGGVVDD